MLTPTNYLTPLTTHLSSLSVTAIGALAITVTATAEMALRVPYDLYQITQTRKNIDLINDSTFTDRLKELRTDLKGDFWGAAFYGLCAANIVPGSAVIGAAIFVLYSINKCEEENAYLASKLIGKPIVYLAKDVVLPAIKKVSELAWDILKTVCKRLGNFLYYAKDWLPSPAHPAFIGVVALTITAVAYKAFFAP